MSYLGAIYESKVLNRYFSLATNEERVSNNKYL